jgi:heat-inducible transcriptional repressor
MLSERQERVLSLVVDAYLADGRPVGSRAIAGRDEIEWGPSTVRNELAELEKQGLLTHPHTSAGRVPTDAGYRFYADALLASGDSMPAKRSPTLELTQMRREVDEAMRETTTALSRITDLMALVTAPPLETATIHRVEALRLQANVVMVIVITSTGAVTKRVFSFDAPVDSGLLEWASSYLNESLSGMGVGARMIASRLSDPELGAAESSFISRFTPAFTDLEQASGESLYVDGAARLLSESHAADLREVDKLMTALEGRASVLRMLRSALDERSVFLWIGDENPQPELRSVSVVGANYGLGHRNLGSVGVVGPMRMDYANVIASVREAARELSHYFETVYGP